MQKGAFHACIRIRILLAKLARKWRFETPLLCVDYAGSAFILKHLGLAMSVQHESILNKWSHVVMMSEPSAKSTSHPDCMLDCGGSWYEVKG